MFELNAIADEIKEGFIELTKEQHRMNELLTSILVDMKEQQLRQVQK